MARNLRQKISRTNSIFAGLGHNLWGTAMIDLLHDYRFDLFRSQHRRNDIEHLTLDQPGVWNQRFLCPIGDKPKQKVIGSAADQRHPALNEFPIVLVGKFKRNHECELPLLAAIGY